ncbi:lactate utilization protein [Acidaminobacter sp. JC074]|uniref:lactate utilization protein n=1 Tax=Acidaminobacter sp. JC074 TaxID=2530199 RepID=UPI001F0F15CA|nr:lactate utilization protein [Acidaminobacter sp. JC074]
MRLNDIKNNFEDRNIEFKYFESEKDLLVSIENEMRKHETIGIGNSQTLKHYEISDMALKLGKVVYDKTLSEDKDQVRKLKKQALLSDCYITSSNAITEDGKIINVDHSGNRVAAMTYGPDRVLVLVGINKLTLNEQAGIKRVLNVATPKNAKRAKIASPCSMEMSCDTCHQGVRVCNYLSIIRGQNTKGRMKVYLINKELGF